MDIQNSNRLGQNSRPILSLNFQEKYLLPSTHINELNIKIVPSGHTQNTGRIMQNLANRPGAHTACATRRHLSACPSTQDTCGLTVAGRWTRRITIALQKSCLVSSTLTVVHHLGFCFVRLTPTIRTFLDSRWVSQYSSSCCSMPVEGITRDNTRTQSGNETHQRNAWEERTGLTSKHFEGRK